MQFTIPLIYEIHSILDGLYYSLAIEKQNLISCYNMDCKSSLTGYLVLSLP